MTGSNPDLGAAARVVLDRFLPVARVTRLEALGNRGGFSGAQIWRVETEANSLCLRAWPLGQTSERLAGIHRLMRHARASGLEFVPEVWLTSAGESFVSHASRLWEVMTWLPGRADFHVAPSAARLEAACLALAQLHRAWKHDERQAEICPAVERRLQHVRDWLARADSHWLVPTGRGVDPIAPWAERAWRLVRPHLRLLERKLTPWLNRAGPVQPCLCDIWHDHILFDGDRVSGLIDYGAIKVDHIAVDLARLLGSLVEDDADVRQAGLKAYQRLRPLSLEDEALVAVLDEATTILGTANWLKWVYVEGKQFEDLHGVAARLARLVQRMERWQ